MYNLSDNAGTADEQLETVEACQFHFGGELPALAVRLPDRRRINVDLTNGEIYIEGMDIEYIDQHEFFAGDAG